MKTGFKKGLLRTQVLILVVLLMSSSMVYARGGGGHSSSSGSVHVNGYYKSDGTYVEPHTRTAPDGIKENNFSYHDNTNTSSTATEQIAGPKEKASIKEEIIPAPLKVHQEIQAEKIPQPSLKPIEPPAKAPTALATNHHSSKSYPSVIKKHGSLKASTATRDKRGRIKRSAAAKREFMKQTGYPNGRPGYVVDHKVPLKRGGRDDPSNMQWQTVQAAKAKDKWE